MRRAIRWLSRITNWLVVCLALVVLLVLRLRNEKDGAEITSMETQCSRLQSAWEQFCEVEAADIAEARLQDRIRTALEACTSCDQLPNIETNRIIATRNRYDFFFHLPDGKHWLAVEPMGIRSGEMNKLSTLIPLAPNSGYSFERSKDTVPAPYLLKSNNPEFQSVTWQPQSHRRNDRGIRLPDIRGCAVYPNAFSSVQFRWSKTPLLQKTPKQSFPKPLVLGQVHEHPRVAPFRVSIVSETTPVIQVSDIIMFKRLGENVQVGRYVEDGLYEITRPIDRVLRRYINDDAAPISFGTPEPDA